ncbi:hypothetical protein IC229_35005 [Spirosoma sp. BT702]|uniref:Uncharacterized protein n=1 Tax=Spirosoma profusum TaxID=2771354 RepID=A0A927AWQ6_9BACT|nr:hypothetical protein [Spirosoma profusum]MBD2705860.1 hypothetical protein [Spirosoma profusum]
MELNQQDQAPNYDWQEQHERAAGKEQDRYGKLSVTDILHRVELGQYGEYNMIWHTLAEEAMLQQAGWTLFRVLQRDEVDYLIRCNCAEALLELLGRTDVLQTLNEAVNLTKGSPAERQPYLLALEGELTQQLGAKPA